MDWLYLTDVRLWENYHFIISIGDEVLTDKVEIFDERQVGFD